MCVLSALTTNGTVSMRLIAIGRAFHNRGPTTLYERSAKLNSMSARYSGALPLMHRKKCRRKLNATFDRKPVQLLENWCDVVTAWCEGKYTGS